MCGARVCVLSSDGLFLVNIRTPLALPRVHPRLRDQILHRVLSELSMEGKHQPGPTEDPARAERSSRDRKQRRRGAGLRIPSATHSYECTSAVSQKKGQKENEVNANVNKTKSTRGKDLANQTLFVAEISNVFK